MCETATVIALEVCGAVLCVSSCGGARRTDCHAAHIEQRQKAQSLAPLLSSPPREVVATFRQALRVHCGVLYARHAMWIVIV